MTIGEAWLRRDEARSPELVARYEHAVAQLKRGVPLAYAVGSVGFRTLDLAIDPRALIPRPETEGLVELVLGRCSTGLVADIGTGCGCIALSLAVEGHFDKVVAVERSPAAAALARENVKRIAPSTPVEVRVGNLLAPLADKAERFRAILSNPPYLSSADHAHLDTSVAAFEPREALVSGSDGLDATRELFAAAGALLQPGGLLALEIDERRADAVRNVGRRFGWNVEIYDDVFGCPRYALSIKEA
ncbi:MAG: peptide chain release factor N(5)-glutamine methyltransferase [Gemmatimonadetes bacterium]|nr:MAG: protein-(glutamine-N5) methyltransferase, release factor-specific [Gemmatimonadetes bacterium 13_1_40CM_3_66_12]OLD86086.1 MAG: protein-(glutamine-N5) methyltransferase, release factor-specific [Gemmatimonadetes bacterium 13_1_20CM_4_66_11]PYP97808.1 MAG: peptide chain release factor N(5)-glutamine methyltransferase [Gemmatimonadota bacterium]